MSALDLPILVLNKNWTAVCTTTARSTFRLLCRDGARVVCPLSYEVYDLPAWLERSVQRRHDLPKEKVIKTPNCAVECPEVILLSVYGGQPRTEVAFSRRNLYRRDGLCCQYCHSRHTPSQLSIDHVLPRSRGGKTSWENCVLACLRCNTKKANRTPRESGLKLLRPPRRPAWSPLLETLPNLRPESWSKFIRDAG